MNESSVLRTTNKESFPEKKEVSNTKVNEVIKDEEGYSHTKRRVEGNMNKLYSCPFFCDASTLGFLVHTFVFYTSLMTTHTNVLVFSDNLAHEFQVH